VEQPEAEMGLQHRNETAKLMVEGFDGPFPRSQEFCRLSSEYLKSILLAPRIRTFFLTGVQGVPGGMCQTSGECSLS